MKSNVDEVDLKIIEMLERDARTSFREIAKELKISEATVYNRVKRMQEEGIIKGYSVKVDPSKLGLDLSAVIGLRVAGGHLVEVEQEISKLKEVCCVYDVTGDYDAVIIARFRSRSDLNKFIKNVLSNPYVERSVTHVVLNTVKEDFTVTL
ncbi:MAG: AsnC family transcriptional regulator [Hadesarchaea archaeon YNP_N21]|jgi:DNA-binding Lrp family transcriptional regulator|nr:MAG: AsnC family transcriptional regulator [Hadesarchaea archaeon YNP_N21]